MKRACFVGTILAALGAVHTFAADVPSDNSAPDSSSKILTPAAPPRRASTAAVFGVRPGKPFLYTIPATGDRPMTFAAEPLPPG